MRLDATVAEKIRTGDYLKAEIVYSAKAEGARHLDDILARRTRISIEAWDRGVEAAEAAARLVAPVLGWDEATIEREVAFYLRRVQSERDSQDQPDDEPGDQKGQRSGNQELLDEVDKRAHGVPL